MKNLYTRSGTMYQLLNRYITDDLTTLTLVLPYLSLRDLARFSMTCNAVKDSISMYYGSYDDFRDRLIQHFDLCQCVTCHVWRRELFLENCGHCEEPICEGHGDGRHCNECSREFCDDCHHDPHKSAPRNDHSFLKTIHDAKHGMSHIDTNQNVVSIDHENHHKNHNT
jgi:hypothetical protein